MLARHSRFFYEVLVALDRVGADLARRGYLHGVELDIYRHGLAFPPFAESVATTERIIARMRARLDGVPLVAVATDDYPVPWPEIFRRQGVPYIEDAVRSVEAEEAKGAKLRLTDGRHWNAEGHEIVGRSLAGWISLFLASRK